MRSIFFRNRTGFLFKDISLSVLLMFSIGVFAQSGNTTRTVKYPLLEKERWWGGVVNKAHEMPFDEGASIELSGNSYGNQTSPLLISSQGRYIWSEKPFFFRIAKDSITVEFTGDGNIFVSESKNLKSACRNVSERYFRADGKMPDSLLFSAPQYNTWIELIYDQNQKDILKYAHNIIDNGFPPGVLMIDDNWFPSYGNFSFRKDRFPDPKQMVDELHHLGFKVMLWVCPFISPDSEIFREVLQKRLILFDRKGNEKLQWKDAVEPAIIKWWNGYSAVFDFSNPEALIWFKEKLNILETKYGVDGFKFDAGDAEFYTGEIVSFENIDANQHSERWGTIGLDYPLNEYRAMWKNAGKPLVERLRDKFHTWEDLQKLIPHATLAGLLGYAFVCPDMIGGGDYSSFINDQTLDQDLIVRSAQCHALMPMMQFSVAPWRVLDSIHLLAVKKAVELRATMVPYILSLAGQAATTGAPIIRSMEFAFPHQGFETINDQFMLGDDILVAPILSKTGVRKIVLPKGKWRDMNKNKTITGPKTIEVSGEINLLPYFQRL